MSNITERMKKYEELDAEDVLHLANVQGIYADLQATVRALEVARDGLSDNELIPDVINALRGGKPMEYFYRDALADNLQAVLNSQMQALAAINQTLGKE